MKAFLSKIYAKSVARNIRKWSENPFHAQQKVFKELITTAENTRFGKEHFFKEIKTYSDFKKNVPICDYEDLTPYIEEIKLGTPDILWPGKPIYLSKTSGTTSGTKYIPISKESIHNHIDCARNALLCYIAETGNTDFVNGKMIFLQGSPELANNNGIPVGRLSGIVAHHVPAYLLKNRMPSYKTNCIEDWEKKVDAIVEETKNEKMTLISGIPPWVQMYFDKLIEKTGKKNISEIFPKFSLFVYGGVSFEPYRLRFEQSIGKKINSIEVYPASEGFIAFQDSQKEQGLLLVLNKGIFYEFIPAEEYYNENHTRISIESVELNKNYALILNTNAGLWGYSIGDTIKFISKNPYRLIVTGRIKHFTSAFGEHVIAEEVEFSLQQTLLKFPAEITEFHVAPQVQPQEGLPYHEWFIEFTKEPENIASFCTEIDIILQNKNVYYKDLRQGNMLSELKISRLKKNTYIDYMKKMGKLGGQNKVPRLANNRNIANELKNFAL
jgi:hypothetical protein